MKQFSDGFYRVPASLPGQAVARFNTELAAEYCRHYRLEVEYREYLKPLLADKNSGEFWQSMDEGISRGHEDGARRAFAHQYAGQSITSIEPHSLLDTAGIYMPDINLHLGFEHVCKTARDGLKRELVKSERKPLFEAFVRACNKYQLVCLPDQAALPFEIAAGSIWDRTDGRMARYCVLVEKTLGRFMTRKEGVFIRNQWPALTSAKRSRIKDQSHTNAIKDGQTIYTTKGRGNMHSLLDAVHGYSGAVARLRKMLAAGTIDHEFYNGRLSSLRKLRDRALDIIKEDGIPDTRAAYGRGHVSNNAAGVAPEKAPNASKSYAYDAYRIDPETGDYGSSGQFGEDMRTPTIWNDGTRRN